MQAQLVASKKESSSQAVCDLTFLDFAALDLNFSQFIVQDALTKLGARASSLEADLAKANLQISNQTVLTCIRMRMNTLSLEQLR